MGKEIDNKPNVCVLVALVEGIDDDYKCLRVVQVGEGTSDKLFELLS